MKKKERKNEQKSARKKIRQIKYNWTYTLTFFQRQLFLQLRQRRCRGASLSSQMSWLLHLSGPAPDPLWSGSVISWLGLPRPSLSQAQLSLAEICGGNLSNERLSWITEIHLQKSPSSLVFQKCKSETAHDNMQHVVCVLQWLLCYLMHIYIYTYNTTG